MEEKSTEKVGFCHENSATTYKSVRSTLVLGGPGVSKSTWLVSELPQSPLVWFHFAGKRRSGLVRGSMGWPLAGLQGPDSWVWTNAKGSGIGVGDFNLLVQCLAQPCTLSTHSQSKSNFNLLVQNIRQNFNKLHHGKYSPMP